MDSVDLARYPEDRVAAMTDAPVTFCYVGVMAPNRWKVLRIVAEAVEALRRRGSPCRFHIYTLPSDADRYAPVLNLSDGVRIVGSVPYADVPATQMAADVLVHAEAFAEGIDAARTSLSVSTKIPQYLAAGRAILAVGPSNIASIQYLGATGAAVVVDAPETEHVVREVQRLAYDDALRRELGRRGRAYCEEHHTRGAMVSRLRSAIEEAVCGSRFGA
jgi:glycosyltransferase involved in cell wall biosynthesis